MVKHVFVTKQKSFPIIYPVQLLGTCLLLKLFFPSGLLTIKPFCGYTTTLVEGSVTVIFSVWKQVFLGNFGMSLRFKFG